jgi:tellurium resistance protein TerD
MAVALKKGGDDPQPEGAGTEPLTNVVVSLTWDVDFSTGVDFDLDATGLMVGPNGKVLSDAHFIFYNNLDSPDGSLRHKGDRRTDDVHDEVIEADLTSVPSAVDRIVFVVSLHDADSLGQNFGQTQNALVRVVDATSNQELGRYELSEDASTQTAIVFGELYRRENDWKFRTIGRGYHSGLEGIVRDYGVSVA